MSFVHGSIFPMQLLNILNEILLTRDGGSFGAGPALLPTAVLEEAAAALLNYNATGLGGMELPEAVVLLPPLSPGRILK